MCPWKTGVGKCPTWTSPNYWGYNHQQILESDVQNPLKQYIYQPLEKPSSIHDCCGGRRIGQETLLWRRRSPCSNPALQATSLLELVWLALPHKDLSELKKRRKITRNCWFMRDSLDNDNLVGGWATPLKNITQLGWLFPIYGKRKNVPNHQSVMIVRVLIAAIVRSLKLVARQVRTVFWKSFCNDLGTYDSRLNLRTWIRTKEKRHYLNVALAKAFFELSPTHFFLKHNFLLPTSCSINLAAISP